MSGTVDPRWFRQASWVAQQRLAKRRRDELLAAASTHYATYPQSGQSRAFLFEYGDEHNDVTLIERPAIPAYAMLLAEVSAAVRVRQLREQYAPDVAPVDESELRRRRAYMPHRREQRRRQREQQLRVAS